MTDIVGKILYVPTLLAWGLTVVVLFITAPPAYFLIRQIKGENYCSKMAAEPVKLQRGVC